MASYSVVANSSNECKDEDALNNSLRTCANEPDFAVICAFLQKFSKDLGIDGPNFKLLQEWLTNTDEVSDTLRDLHIKLLRKTRRTVHEKSWESALSKFCFSYSLQDAWEIERFGYKKASLKVKLRVLRELLESQFERNAKFRAKILQLSADSLRSEPIGRDRHGHAYWLTQDKDCNLRIYQEHLDEEIWQVVATNREEFVNLITRLRGNEVVLPSTDIGAADEDSSSNSYNATLEKPPPPEEKDDSQEANMDIKVPNLKITLNTMGGENTIEEVVERVKDKNAPEEVVESSAGERKVKPLIIMQTKVSSASPTNSCSSGNAKKRNADELDRSSPIEMHHTKTKSRPLLMDSKRAKNQSKYARAASEDEDDDEEDGDDEEEDDDDDEDDVDDEGEDDEEEIGEEECEEEDIDSAAADTCEQEEKEVEENDDNENNATVVGPAIEDPPVIVHGSGAGKDCESSIKDVQSVDAFHCFSFEMTEDEDDNPIDGEEIVEDKQYVLGFGEGALSMVGNKKTEDSETEEPKAKFFFGEPGCLKLSPLKATSTPESSIPKPQKEKEANTENENNELAKIADDEEEGAELSKVNDLAPKQIDKPKEKEKQETVVNDSEIQYKEEEEEEENKICEKSSELAKKIANRKESSDHEDDELKIQENSNQNDNAANSVKDEELTKSNEEENTEELEHNEKNKRKATQLGVTGEGKTEKLGKEVESINQICKKHIKSQSENNLELSENNGIKKVESIEEDVEGIENSNSREKSSKESKEDNLAKATAVLEDDHKSDRLMEKSANANEKTGQSEKLCSSNNTQKERNTELNKDPLTSCSSKTEISKSSTENLPNRKRRLSDFTKDTAPRSNSESELDLNSDQQVAGDCSEELQQENVGGKRLKMRQKLSNLEIRRKVEAKKALKDETASSSGEEDSHRRRNCSEAKLVGARESERNADVCANSITTVQTVVIDAKTMSPGILQNEPKSIQMKKDDKNVEPQTFSTKNKLPITKPLKKNLLTKVRSAEIDAEKHVPPTNPESVMSGVHKSENDAESVLSIEESEGAKEISKEEDHLKKCKLNKEKRKSIDSEPEIKECKIEKMESNAIDDLENVKIENETEAEKKPATDGDKHEMEKKDTGTSNSARSSKDFKKEQNNFKTEKEISNACEVNERKAIAGQLKRRSSEEHNEKDEPEVESADLLTKSTKKKAIDSPAECIETKNKIEVSPQNVKATNVSTKRQTTPPPVEPIGRRSGRRNASLVVYAELPQPKRTRAGTANNSNQPSSGTTKSTNKNVTTTQTEKSSSITSPTVVSKATSAKTTSEAQTKTPLVKTKPESTTTETLSSTKSVKQTKGTAKNTKTPTTDKKETEDKATKATPSRVVSGARKKLEVDTTNIIELNDSETPVRQSRRIAQQKIREEAERRKLEEIALRTMKQELKKKKIAEKEVDPTVTLPSEDSSSSSLASSATDATAVEQKKKSKKKQPGKDGSWSSGSEEQEDPEEEDEEPHHYSDPGSPLFKSDHEFSPESDLEDESQVVPMKRARTARKEDADASEQVGDEEENCQKCGKSDHPEWILLCDKCDKGYHCSCLSPVLFYIPEGDWYCPPCQQDQLIITLEKQLTEFDALVARKIIEDEEEKRRQEKEAEKAAKEEQERLENEKIKKDRKKSRKGKSRRNSSDNDENDHENDNSNKYAGESSDDSEVLSKVGGKKKRQSDESGAASEDSTKNSGKTRDKNKTSTRSKKSSHKDKSSKRSRGDGRSRRKAAKRCDRQRRRIDSDHSSTSGSSSNSGSDSDSSSSLSSTDSDDEPIYKLRKRRQINVSYRLNEYDDLINSALKKEMDEVAGAGNLGRGKDISTIIDADKDEKAEKKDCDDDDGGDGDVGESEKEAKKSKWKSGKNEDKDDKDDEPITKRKMKSGSSLKKKSRKLTTLDISSEEDDGSDEDFKTSSVEDDEEDTSVSVSSNSDSSLEVYRSRNKGGKKSHRKAARRAARERRKQSKFVVDDSFDDEDDKPLKQRSKKKKKSDSDFTETDVDEDELSELSENLNSSDLCDDSSSEQSDGAWHPSKRQKKRKSNAAKPSQKIETEKKTQRKKLKRLEYSDDDLSESDEETDEEGDDIAVSGKGKGSGKQPRSQPIKPGTKAKPKPKTMPTGSKHFSDEDPDSLPESADSDDSTRRTRGKRYAYIEDYEDDSSDGGIKPGVKRPDTPPEERQKFIEKQEEIKRMLAAKNAEGAKIAATPRLTPIKGGGASNEKQNSSSAKTGAGDALSAVPLSVIRQAKVLDIDYLQRKGEPLDNVLENVDDVDSEFDDTDLPDDLPEDMDEDTIARMVEEEEELNAVVGGGSRDLSGSDKKVKEPEKIPSTVFVRNPASHSPHMTTQQTSQIHASAPAHPAGHSSNYGLQEPLRKRLPMPTIHPPLLRHQYHHSPDYINPNQLMHRAQSQAAPPMHLLQSALSMPIGQPLRGNFPSQQNRMPNMGTPPPRNVAPILRPGQPSQQLSPSVSHHQRLPAAAAAEQTAESVSESKPRGRRKKITPLRDPMQKQQAAAAVAAAASASSLDKKTAEAVKTKQQQQQQPDAVPTTSPLNIAQPPQLFTSTTVSGAENQPSVITRMPLMPRAPNDMPPGYYNPSLVTGPRIVRPPGSLAGLAPHGSMRPTYGPPPLHASIGPNVPGGGPPTNLSRPHIPGQPISGMYVRSAVPPPARHSTSHLNPYRPHVYGNPNYPRGAPNQTSTAGNIRGGPSVDYGGYSPYGPYYPPAPHQPLAAPPHHELQSAAQTQQQQPLTSSLPSTAQASSVIVTAPHTVNLVPTPSTVPPPNTVPTNHSVSAITRTVSPANPREEQLSSTKPAACTTTPPVPMPVVVHPNSNKTEIRKNLTTLETYSTDIVAKRVKSPMQIVAAGESSNSASRGSPVTAAPDIADDSSSALGPSLTPAAAVATSETPASEFSGLVSYFSSQHDDYNS